MSSHNGSLNHYNQVQDPIAVRHWSDSILISTISMLGHIPNRSLPTLTKFPVDHPDLYCCKQIRGLVRANPLYPRQEELYRRWRAYVSKQTGNGLTESTLVDASPMRLETIKKLSISTAKYWSLIQGKRFGHYHAHDQPNES